MKGIVYILLLNQERWSICSQSQDDLFMFAIRKSPFGVVNIIHFDRPQCFLEFLYNILDHATLYVCTMYNGTHTHTRTHIRKYAHIEWTEKHRKTIVWKNTRA